MDSPRPAPSPGDLQFAERVLSQGLCSREKIDECLSLIDRMRAEGATPLPSLNEMLVRQGYLAADLLEATVRQTPPSTARRDVTKSRPAELPPEVRSAEGAPGSRMGKYVRVARIGAGGMGEVWRGWDLDLGRWVALKFLKHDEPEELARFQREAQTSARLSHPHIASVYEVGDFNGKPFIAMQFVAGRTFSTVPRDRVRLLVELVRDAAAAVQYAHEKGVVHRDLKPANLMVESSSSDGKLRVFVMDFGLAKQTTVDSSLSVAGQILGTPAYMPPEQARGDTQAVGERSDIYSLGTTLYELLADRPPFLEKDVYALLKKVVEEEPPPLRKFRPKIDLDLETVVMKCLEKDPARRYGSAREFVEDLNRWLEGEAILAHPPSATYRFWKFAARKKGILAVAVAGIAAVGLMAAILVPKLRSQKEETERLAAARESERRASSLREQALKELGSMWAEAIVVKEWTRQPFRKPGDIRAELEKAIEKVGGYIGRHPDHPQGFYVRARERRDLGDLAGSEADLVEALRIEHGFAPGWALLARLKLDRHARMLFSADELARVERAAAAGALAREASEALARGWDKGAEALAVERWGLSRTREDEINETVAQALKELFVEKNEARAYELIQAAQLQAPSEEYCRLLGNWSKDSAGKRVWYDQALKIAPHFAAGYFDRGCARAVAGDVAGAIDDFTSTVTIDPRHAMAFGNRGVARQFRGDLRGALEDFVRSIELEPGVAMSYCHRGAARHDTGDLEGALEDFNRAISMDPRVTRAYYNRGLLWDDRGDLDKARADFARTVEINPEFAEAYTNLGLVCARKGDLEGAITEFTKAIEHKPRYARAYYNRGLARSMKKDLAGAIEDYSWSLEIEPDNPDALTNRGVARRSLRQGPEAVADFERALQIAPKGWPHRAAVEGWRDAARQEK